MITLYSDGGVIGKNPSLLGGTWAFIAVEGKFVTHRDSGILQPDDLEMKDISNNVTELYAALRALEYALKLDPKWSGTLYTDSNCTLLRLTKTALVKLPEFSRKRIEVVRKDAKWNISLLAGHPNKAELRLGKNSRGKPVSMWNVECDKECNRQADVFRSRGKK